MVSISRKTKKANIDIAVANKTISTPIAAAIWLVENTKLTFAQIANFCGLHELEVGSIANGSAWKNIVGISPVNHYITTEDLMECEADPKKMLVVTQNSLKLTKGAKIPKLRTYVPMLQRRSKPDAVLWILHFAPHISDRDIVRLVGTTLQTIKAIKDGTHKRMNLLTPQDPVILGLCSQVDFDIASNRGKK